MSDTKASATEVSRFARGSKSLVATPCALLLAALLIGPQIFYQQYESINPDTYQYIALAASYIHKPLDIFRRDSYTVGPVISLLIAGGKVIAQGIGFSGIDTDVAIVKCIAAASYLLITRGIIRLAGVRHLLGASSAIAVALLLFLPMSVDTLSLNGELLCSALIITLMVLLERSNAIKSLLAIVALSILVCYTKLQASPILATILISHFWRRDKGNLASFVALFSAAFITVESIFFFHGGGITHRLFDLLSYSGFDASTKAGIPLFAAQLLRRLLRYLYWPVSNLVRLFPLLVVTTTLLFVHAGEPLTRFDRRYLAVLFAATIVSILFSGYLFEHYLLLGLPLLAATVERTKGVFSRIDNRQPWFALALSGLLVASRFADVSLQPGRPIRFKPLPEWAEMSDAVALRQVIPAGPQPNVLIHGWDFAWYSALGKADPEVNLNRLAIGRTSAHQYVAEIRAKRIDYILDVTNRSGMLRGSDFNLASTNDFSVRLLPLYTPVWYGNGLTLYKRKGI